MATQGQVAMSGLKNQVAVSDGTVAGPSVSFSNDPNTGLYRPAGDVVGVVTGGVERMRVGSDGNVGIGVVNPQATLDVGGSMNYTTTLTRNGVTPPMAKYGRLVTKTATGRLNYYQKIYDTHNAVTTGTNWVFTVPPNCSGFYYVDAFVYKNDSTLQYVDIAGSVFYRLWETSEIAFQGTGTVVKLNAGNTLYFNNATAASIGDAGGADGQYAYCTIACILLSP